VAEANVELFDETFRLNEAEEYEWAMMEFASAAKGGADGDLLSGAAIVFDFLRTVIHEDDWERFRKTAKVNKAQVQRDLMPIVVTAFTREVSRPTERPSVSSDGPSTTKLKSAGGSSSEVVARLEEQGRPDLALLVSQSEAARSAA
jgi:hypothetical protein